MFYGSLFAGQLFRGGLFKGSLFGAGGSNPLAALIRALFSAGEQGGLWLPGPVDTFTDTAGTTAAVVTNTAARNNDRSPNAAHAIQATEAARPALGRTVEGGRRNILLATEAFDNAAWNAIHLTVTANAATAPNGQNTADLLVPKASGNTTRFANGTPTNVEGVGVAQTHSVYVKAAGYSKCALRESAATGAYASFDLATASLIETGNAGSLVASNATIESVGDGWYRISCTFTSSSGAVTQGFGFWLLPDSYTTGAPTVAWNGDGVKGFYAWGAQFEVAATLSPYQRVGASALDVTEAGKPELYYLRDDGIDDALVATFSASLGTACTTIIAHSAGITTLTGQTIGTTYDILQSTNVFGAIVVDRALTAGEQANVDAYLGERHP